MFGRRQVGDLTTHKMRLAALLLAAGTLLSAGCSAIKLGYETLPTWAFFQIDRYWKLDSTQSELAKARLDEFQRWHRHAELPQYVRLLSGVRDRVRTPIEAADVQRWRTDADAHWRALAQRAAAPLAEVALTLRPEQIDRMKKRVAEQNVEHRKKILPADLKERQERRIERVEERAEFFMGRLTHEQREIVRQHAGSLATDDDALYAERLARQQAMVSTIERIATTHPPREEAARQLEAVLVQLWKPRDAQRAAAQEHSATATDQLTALLANSASPAQRSRIGQRLSGWMSDFEILAAK